MAMLGKAGADGEKPWGERTTGWQRRKLAEIGSGVEGKMVDPLLHNARTTEQGKVLMDSGLSVRPGFGVADELLRKDPPNMRFAMPDLNSWGETQEAGMNAILTPDLAALVELASATKEDALRVLYSFNTLEQPQPESWRQITYEDDPDAPVSLLVYGHTSGPGASMPLEMSSMRVEHAQRQHADRQFRDPEPSLSRATAQWLAVREGEKLGLFINMALLTLGVNDGPYTIDCGTGMMTEVPDPIQDRVDQGRAAARLSGVRVSDHCCGDIEAALIVAACNPDAISGISGRVSKLLWSEVPVCLYGETRPYTQMVQMVSSEEAGRALLHLAREWDAVGELQVAFGAAMWIYGNNVRPAVLALDVPTPSMFFPDGAGSLTRWPVVDEWGWLASGQANSAARLLSRAAEEVCSATLGHLYRTQLHIVRSRAERSLTRDWLAEAVAALKDVSALFERYAKCPFFYEYKASDWVASMLKPKGVACAIAVGVVPAGSFIEACVQPLTVPSMNSGVGRTAPGYDKGHMQAMKRLGLHNALYSGGVELCHSTKLEEWAGRMGAVVPQGAVMYFTVHGCQAALQEPWEWAGPEWDEDENEDWSGGGGLADWPTLDAKVGEAWQVELEEREPDRLGQKEALPEELEWTRLRQMPSDPVPIQPVAPVGVPDPYQGAFQRLSREGQTGAARFQEMPREYQEVVRSEPMADRMDWRQAHHVLIGSPPAPDVTAPKGPDDWQEILSKAGYGATWPTPTVLADRSHNVLIQGEGAPTNVIMPDGSGGYHRLRLTTGVV